MNACRTWALQGSSCRQKLISSMRAHVCWGLERYRLCANRLGVWRSTPFPDRCWIVDIRISHFWVFQREIDLTDVVTRNGKLGVVFGEDVVVVQSPSPRCLVRMWWWFSRHHLAVWWGCGGGSVAITPLSAPLHCQPSMCPESTPRRSDRF